METQLCFDFAAQEQAQPVPSYDELAAMLSVHGLRFAVHAGGGEPPAVYIETAQPLPPDVDAAFGHWQGGLGQWFGELTEHFAVDHPGDPELAEALAESAMNRTIPRRVASREELPF